MSFFSSAPLILEANIFDVAYTFHGIFQRTRADENELHARQFLADLDVCADTLFYREMTEINNILKGKIQKLWAEKNVCARYSQNCKSIGVDTIDEYYNKPMFAPSTGVPYIWDSITEKGQFSYHSDG